MKKWIPALLCMIAASMVMSGCAAGNATANAPAATNSPTARATAQATMEPAATVQPMTPTDSPAAQTSDMPMAGQAGAMEAGAQMTPAQAGRMAERISEAVERISEVDDAEVILSDNRVLVAVEFDDQYRAGLDERMKETIVKAVQGVDKSLTDIEITDDGTLYGQIKSLAERMGKATGLDELADDFGDLWDRVTGM